ncbi:MAG: oligopeptide transporter, OPT family [Alphaproteobacteria bacterium]|nr:oligopeptide transporter, OPT family [Alphaproteobacteria bacterium]
MTLKKPETCIAELSIRGLLLGVAITLIFTAANVYLGLKVGLTFATSIPAAVISMGALSLFRNTSILENNIVQTVASAAGALASIIFVLPGLVIVGWWTGIPFWPAFFICAGGGIIGVIFTIPLRRAMVTQSDLPYPEGVAAAQVLKVGSAARDAQAATNGSARRGLMAVVYGAAASLALSILTATQIAAAGIQSFVRVGRNSVTGFDFSFSLALVGAGHLVGLSVGLALLLGVLIAWGAAVPFLAAASGIPAHADIADFANQIWRTQVRFMGAGAIAVAALWTLVKLARPVAAGLVSTIAASRRVGRAPTDRDMGPVAIAGWVFVCLCVVVALVLYFVRGTSLAGHEGLLSLVTLGFVVFGGFLVSAICGYLAGLVGSTNSPISGVGILAVLLYASILAIVIPLHGGSPKTLIAFTLFSLSIVFAAATTSNDNLQDLKTGQLVGASPWAQQWALIVGVVAGALTIPPVLDLLTRAYGFAGQAAGPVSATATPLAAPQAVLISALAQGVLGESLDWHMLGAGAVIGVAIIALDEFLGARKWMRLPPLGVCIGIYLPMAASLPVVLGALISQWFKIRARKAADPETTEQYGVLVASGLIVGESLFGVALAGLIVASGKEAPLALVGGNFLFAPLIGIAVFAALIVVLYRKMLRLRVLA